MEDSGSISTAHPSGAFLLWDPPWQGCPWKPRAWQDAAWAPVARFLEEGRPAIVQAVMGAGKSKLIAEVAHVAADAMLQGCVVVIVTPTRKLVSQLAETCRERSGDRVGRYFTDAKEIRPITVTCNPSLEPLLQEMAEQGLRPAILIIDEAHKSQAPQILSAIRWLQEREITPARLGFSATPFRSDDAERLVLWTDLAFRYGLGDALRDGVLVPWRVHNWEGGEVDEIDPVCLGMIREHAQGPGIVSAVSIDDAEAFAATATAAGIPMLAIHSRQSGSEQEARLAMLKRQEIRALVHVSLLAEGVDLPWLRWLCLRRPVGSPVRFLQEIGRVLRTDPENPGKTDAPILDPHDLFGAIGIAHAPALGGAELDRAVREELEPNEEGEATPKLIPPAKAIELATSWTRRVLLALQAAGYGLENASAGGAWRTMRPSPQQLAAILGSGGKPGLQKMSRYIPKPHRDGIKMLCQPNILPALQKGAVSDLLSILSIVARATKGARQAWATGGAPIERWTWPSEVQIDTLPGTAIKALPPSLIFDWSAGEFREPERIAR